MTVSIYGAARSVLALLAVLTLSACMATTSPSGEMKTWRSGLPAATSPCPCCAHAAMPCCSGMKDGVCVSRPGQMKGCTNMAAGHKGMGCCARMMSGKDGANCCAGMAGGKPGAMQCGGMKGMSNDPSKPMMCQPAK